MGLPDSLDGELAALSTDLGDLWGAQKELADQLERLVRSEADWSAVGDHLVDLRATVDHISWSAPEQRPAAHDEDHPLRVPGRVAGGIGELV